MFSFFYLFPIVVAAVNSQHGLPKGTALTNGTYIRDLNKIGTFQTNVNCNCKNENLSVNSNGYHVNSYPSSTRTTKHTCQHTIILQSQSHIPRQNIVTTSVAGTGL
jgi:hypothetical protein